MKRLILPAAILLALLPPPALAQEQKTDATRPALGSRSFFPKDYTKEFFVDLDQLQDTTIWDVLERTPFSGTMRMKFRQEYGFRIEEVKSVRAAMRWIDEKENSPAGEREVGVTVIEGKTVRLPPVKKVGQSAYLKLESREIRGFPVVEEMGYGPEPRLYVVPKPGCLVMGSAEMIRTVLEGKRRGGVIDARLMALTALRNPLAYAAVGFPPQDDPRYLAEIGMDANWLSDTDPLRHLIARVEFEEKTEVITIKVTFRFKSGKKGPQLLEEGMKGAIAGMKEQPFYTLLKTYFDKLSWKRDREDLHLAVVLKPSDMGGLFGASGLLTYFLMSVAPMPVMKGAPPVVPVEVEVKEVDPAKKKAKPGEKKAKTGEEKSKSGKKKTKTGEKKTKTGAKKTKTGAKKD